MSEKVSLNIPAFGFVPGLISGLVPGLISGFVSRKISGFVPTRDRMLGFGGIRGGEGSDDVVGFVPGLISGFVSREISGFVPTRGSKPRLGGVIGGGVTDDLRGGCNGRRGPPIEGSGASGGRTGTSSVTVVRITISKMLTNKVTKGIYEIFISY